MEQKAYWEDEKTKTVICLHNSKDTYSEKIVKLFIEDGKLIERVACIDPKTGKMMDGFLWHVFERDQEA